MIIGYADLPILMQDLEGKEISPGVTIIGEPSLIPNSNKLRALANVNGALCVVELSISIKFTDNESNSPI